ncbi:MAG TPA: alpha-amylase family glycosyl hydrolase [Kiritimatiellia bacterium]|nr:alpha-amylase family glycosyl hydrolase [Kiritimatiellia bacterium]
MLKRFNHGHWWLSLSLFFLLAGTTPAQSTRPGWGATPYADQAGTGVTFRVWAPNASKITVFGPFNNWNTNATPLVREIPLTNGIWSVDVPAARPGQEYKFSINDTQRRRDPRARQVIHSGEAPGVIYDNHAYYWQTPEFIPPPLEDLVIYELHIGTFNHPNPTENQVGTFYQAIERLDEIALLGINAIHLMPVAEFAGNNSWGYNPSDPFAVESAYGGPDALKAFVDAAHARGLAVILDVVHNHYGPDDLDNSLWEFDGWAGPQGGGIYFYQTPDRALTPWGPRPNYAHPQVRAYIRDNIRMWIEDYRIDGFRWDATLYMRFTTNFAPIAEGELLLREISDMMAMEFPEKIHIAEDLLGDERLTAPLSITNGLGFNSQWDRSFHEILTAQLISDISRNLQVIAGLMTYTGGTRRLIYTESHDEVGYLNEDEGARRFTTEIDPLNPFSYIARKKSTMGAVFALTAPGIPMIFQGQEMLENELFSTTEGVDWTKTNTYSGIVRLYQDAIGLRRNRSGVSAGLQGSFSSASVTNDGTMLLVHRGIPGQPQHDVFIVANLSTNFIDGYWIDFPPADGTWHVHFNSDHAHYSPDFGSWGSTDVFVWPDFRGNPYLAPWSVLILSRHPPPPLDSDRDGIPDTWELLHGLDPHNPRDAWLNPDHDAYTHLEEYRAGTHPNTWNLPRSDIPFLAIPGTFNGWNTSADPMVLIADHLWQRDLVLPAGNHSFKFAANDGWDLNWGLADQARFTAPLTLPLASGAENIIVSNLPAGTYRFRFDEKRARFTLRPVPFPDSDNDGIPDAWELLHGLDPFSSHDAHLIPDGDLYTYRDKFHYRLTPGTWAPPLTDYASMGVIFDFNGWNPSAMNMQQDTNAHYTWFVVTNLFRPQGIQFKFAANGAWDNSWGDWNPPPATLPMNGTAYPLADNIPLSGPLAGNYKFTFNENTLAYTVERLDDGWQPPAFNSMAFSASINNWTITPNMTSNGLHQWSITLPLNWSQNIQFKFVAQADWSLNWGAAVTHPHTLPLTATATFDDPNITLNGPFSGLYTFTFNTATYTYTIQRDGPLPPAYGTMALAGTLNGWNTTPNMTLDSENHWVFETDLAQPGSLAFKFVTSNNWNIANWGDAKTHPVNSPATGTATLSGPDITLPGPFDGRYRFTFNDRTRAYTVTLLPGSTLDLGMNIPSAPGTGLILTWPGPSPATYTIERATTLTPPNFTSIITNLPAPHPLNTYTTPPPGSASAAYYRLRRNP